MEDKCRNEYCISQGKEFWGWCKQCTNRKSLSFLFSCPAKKKYDQRGIEYYHDDIDAFEDSIITTNNDEWTTLDSEDYYKYLSTIEDLNE